MKIDEIVDGGSIIWSLPAHVNINQRVELFESFSNNINLFESNNDSSIEQFKNLWTLSDKIQYGDKCIVVPLCLTNNQLLLVESKIQVMTYLSETENSKTFESNGNQKTYPCDVMTRLGGIWYTFTFLTENNYSKLQMMAILKFDTTLPDVQR